jgi:hypothetical protein
LEFLVVTHEAGRAQISCLSAPDFRDLYALQHPNDIKHHLLAPEQHSKLETRNSKLSFPRSPERAHTKIGEDQREGGCQRNLPRSRRAVLIAMVLPHGRSAANDGEKKEEQSGYLQPEHMRYAANGASSNFARPVEGPHPAVLAALPAGNTKKSPALGTELAG